MNKKLETKKATCVFCGARDVYERRMAANGGYGPFILGGLGGFLRCAKFDVLVCASCGHMSFFADEPSRVEARSHPKWEKVR